MWGLDLKVKKKKKQKQKPWWEHFNCSMVNLIICIWWGWIQTSLQEWSYGHDRCSRTNQHNWKKNYQKALRHLCLPSSKKGKQEASVLSAVWKDTDHLVCINWSDWEERSGIHRIDGMLPWRDILRWWSFHCKGGNFIYRLWNIKMLMTREIMICHKTHTCVRSLIFEIQESYKSHCEQLPFEVVLYVSLKD